MEYTIDLAKSDYIKGKSFEDVRWVVEKAHPDTINEVLIQIHKENWEERKK